MNVFPFSKIASRILSFVGRIGHSGAPAPVAILPATPAPIAALPAKKKTRTRADMRLHTAVTLDRRRQAMFCQLVAFKLGHGHLNVPGNIAQYFPLYTWLLRQRTARSSRTLRSSRLSALTQLGVTWRPRAA